MADSEDDTREPVLDVRITSPTPGQVLTGAGPGITVRGTAEVLRDGTGRPRKVGHVDVRIGDDGEWIRAVGTDVWTATGDIPRNGPLQIWATATSGSDLNDTDSVFVVSSLTDMTPPEVTITAPPAGTTVSGDGTVVPVPVAAEVRDDFLGIAAIDYSFDGSVRAREEFTTPQRSWHGIRVMELDASVRTSRTLTVTATDVAGNARSRDVTVTVTDRTAPALQVFAPQDGSTVPSPGAGRPLEVRGVATDLESGVKSVEVSVNGGPFTPAATGFSGAWRAEVTAPTGRCTITVRCADHAGNQQTVTVRFELARPYVPADASDLFSLQAYLSDLLWFAGTHLLDGAGKPLTPAVLTSAFHQPFELLTDPRHSAASAPVNQVRAAIEVIRRYLSSTGVGLTAHFRFDEDSGTVTADAAGGPGATVSGATWTEGRAGSPALLFDGTSAYVQVPKGRAADITNTFTLAFWALPLASRATDTQATAGVSGISGQRYAFGPQQGGIAYGSAEHAGVGVSVGTNGVSVYEHSDDYLPAALVHDTALTGWTHIAVTYAYQPFPDLMTGEPAGWFPVLYLNGQQVKRGRVSPKPYLHCVPAHLGAEASGHGAYHGRLEDVRIYDRSLWQGQLALLARERESAVAAEYCLLAYRLLLTRLGTSYEELRLARGVASEVRRALAERLGIDPAPDRLDQLLLAPDRVTEAGLARLFGLADTTADPLVVPDPSLLLQWRRQRQERLWAEADHPQPVRASTPLVVDPDLLVPGDFRNRTAGDAAFDLWTVRRKWTDDAFAAVRTAREALSASPPVDAFDAIVKTVLGVPAARLAELDALQRRAVPIDAELGALRLTLEELRHLLRVRGVAGSGIVTEDEWQDLYHLLTHLRKRQQRVAWLVAEQGVALTPGSFLVAATEWAPTPWRGTIADRLDWQDRLQSRIEQADALTEALRTAVGDVEQIALPALRDGLLSLLGTPALEEDRDRLSEELLIDTVGVGNDETTRLAQAVQTLQQLLLLLRTGRLPAQHPARAWRIEPGSAADFDEECSWMGSHEAWRAAMFVFSYPEDLLLPTLRRGSAGPTEAFRALLNTVRGRPRLSRPAALGAAADFLVAVRPLLQAFPLHTLPYTGEDIRDGLLQLRYTDRAGATDLQRLRTLSASVMTHFGTGHPGLPNYLQEVFYYVPLLLAQSLQRAGDFAAALDWYRTIYAFDQEDLPDVFVPSDERKIYYGLEREFNTAAVLSRGSHWLRDELNPHALAANRPNPYTRYTFCSIARCFLEYGDAEFTRDTGESRARARALYLSAAGLLRSPELTVLGGPKALPSPVLTALTASVRNQLRKLRQGRNIAGMIRPAEEPPLPAPGMPAVDTGGRLLAPGQRAQRPTPYRFSVLLDRARQLVATAAQIEAAYLASLEKRDAAAYDRQRAGADLDLARSGEQLQSLRVTEARNTTGLARRQKAVNDVRVSTYQQWIDAGPNVWERMLVSDFDEARVYRDWIAGLDAAMTTTQAIISAMGSGFETPGKMAAAGSVGALSLGKAQNAMQLNRTEQDIQLHTLRAGQERRQEEWELQLALANAEALVAEEAIRAAADHELVIAQEARIAGMQTLQAQATADFLVRKFTNLELYEWMSGVLGGVYGYFLQQATGTAQLAQQQLGFERPPVAPAYVQNDYWEAPADDDAEPGRPGPERGGLTGAARLLQDIEQLAQFAFETDRRKLNLSQTISLAEFAPFEFQMFRDSGVLAFDTQLTDFDRMFPGHYLRLIKRVRVSVVALIPPVSGIRATLTASGISRVVTGPEVFQETVIRRTPESIALTSPTNASGVFELDSQSEMLLPFESMGVATRWQLELPKAANQFDFRSIADVLLTVDYTALSDSGYRAQVIQRLNPRVSAQRAYSFREDFPDAWYELNNPAESATAMTVRFETRRADFPPNLEPGSLRVAQLLLYVSQREGTAEPVRVQRFTLTPTGAKDKIPAASSSAAQSTSEGLISTLAGNWNWLSGEAAPVPVAGTWELAFATDLAERFGKGEIQDLLFVISYSARMPPWPDA
ncbi:hypothetical protein JCM4814A_79770 [Streptomyces phaeofaciens JCM 4814]|uniref:Tc toxin complex TcA C-terminal TcB-binding domain-containing protein n=1 Tax=Streptomyces phaeofaciens TaxID=68254 RepID=A0A918M0L3_9ACTN|nr:Ig-like domain-containing protein [Streptomyces phaeofaciens]GGT92376.1 hypothetical protein GCM10010226_82870 [Streptomyces phaeofaciens]